MKRIGQVAVELDVPPHTVRRWTERFAQFLSSEAAQSYRYTEADIAVLHHICQLVARGLNEKEVEERLQAWQNEQAATASLARTGPEEEAWAEPDGSAGALAYLLRHLDETQQAVLNTQLATRDLLGLVVQDNFNLKEENARLRKRIRALEREVARLKEDDWNHRLSLEERLAALERELERRRPWWKRLLGL